MRTEPSQGTLEERIALAEQALLARDELLRQRASALMQRTQAALEPRRLVRPVAYTVGALALVWLVMRLVTRTPHASADQRTPARATSPQSAGEQSSRLRDLPWGRTAALLWPLLPVAWRGRMGPETASIIVTMGITLAGLLFHKRVLKQERDEGPIPSAGMPPGAMNSTPRTP